MTNKLPNYTSFGGWKYDVPNDIFWVYILKNRKGQLYVGQTKGVILRLQRHNKGDTPQTRDGRPWEIAYTEVCFTREIAVNREKELKNFTALELQNLITSAINDFKTLTL